jgi:hypothetical protein
VSHSGAPSTRVMTFARVFLGTAVVAGVALAAIIWLRWDAPPFRVNRGVDQVIIDTQTLGEYATTVHEIRLIDLSNDAVVWQLLADSGTPQIHRITLTVGPNAAQIQTPTGGYRVAVPSTGAQFVLRRGTPYRIEVWGAPSKFSRRSAEIVFPEPAEGFSR